MAKAKAIENTNELVSQINLISPKGLVFSKGLIEKATAYEFLSKEDRKAKKEEIEELSTNVKKEFAELKNQLNVKIEEDIKIADEQLVKDLEEVKQTAADARAKADADFQAIQNPTDHDKKDYSNSIKGIKFVAKRSRIKANNVHKLAVKDAKVLIDDLYNDYTCLLNALNGNIQVGAAIERKWTVFTKTFSFKEAFLNKQTWINLIPLFMLIILFIVYIVVRDYNKFGSDFVTAFAAVIDKGIFVAVVAVGAVFIFSHGAFDMSLGAASVMCMTISGIVWNASGNVFVTLITSLLFGSLLGTINAILASVLNLPVMVMTLTMMNILNSVRVVILTAFNGSFDVNPGLIETELTGWSTLTTVFLTSLVLFFLLFWAIFNYTKVGRRNKFIGSNRTAAKYNGISLMKAGIISFAISGLGLGLAGFLFCADLSKTSGNIGPVSSLSSIGLNVIIAIVFGGMTTSGGPRSRVSCAIIGAFFCTLLDEIFASFIATVPNIMSYSYIAKGAIFLLVSFFNMYSQRPKKMLASGMGGF